MQRAARQRGGRRFHSRPGQPLQKQRLDVFGDSAAFSYASSRGAA
jgi:hypothetical protein